MADQSVHPSLKPTDQDITFFLNGVEVVGKKGESIINVAAREGVYIPHYCWHPGLSVAGNCRLCLVELHMPNPREDNKVMPMPKPVIACQTTIAPGMHVFTESPLAKECQDGMMEFLLVNHPLDCPICDRGGECMLQRYSMEYGSGHTRMVDKKRKFKKPSVDPLIDIERNRCIMCTRCVRFSDEVAGDHVMGVFARGSDNYIGTFGAGPVSSIMSGNVIDLCPVGCLTSKPFRFKARVWELLQTQSTSIWDASGAKCTYWTRNGKLYRTTPPSRKYHDKYTVNEDTEEFIDNVLRFGSDFPFHEDRWDESRIKIGPSVLPTAFAEAVKKAAAGLAKVKVNHGGNAIATMISPRATMEEGYLAGKFARTVLGNDNIDWRMSFQTVESAEAAALAFANADGDLNDGFDAVVLVNGDYQHTNPTFAMRVKEFARLNDKPIVLIGHHHDRYFAPHAAVRIHCRPGATAKAVALLAQAVKGDAAAKAAFEELTTAVEGAYERLYEILAAEYGKGLLLENLDSMNGLYTEKEVPAVLALKGALGASWKYVPSLKDRNAFGLYTVGAQPGQLPASEEVLRKAWSVADDATIPTEGGLAARNIVESIESGAIKGLLVLGADILAQYPDQERLTKALKSLEFLVISDLFGNSLTELADVFLAAASHLEKDGTMMDVEGNLARLAEVEGLVGGARPEWEMLTGLATMMGADNFRYESVEDVFNEMMSVLAPNFEGSFSGLLLSGPRNDVSISDPGGARRRSPEYNPGDYRVDGAHFRWTGEAVTLDPAGLSDGVAAAPEGEYLIHWGEHIQGRDYHLDRASIKHLLQIPAYVEMNVVDAMVNDVDNRDQAILHLNGVELEVEVRITQGPARGTLYLPNGLGAVDLSGAGSVPSARLEILEVQEPVGAPS